MAEKTESFVGSITNKLEKIFPKETSKGWVSLKIESFKGHELEQVVFVTEEKKKGGVVLENDLFEIGMTLSEPKWDFIRGFVFDEEPKVDYGKVKIDHYQNEIDHLVFWEKNHDNKKFRSLARDYKVKSFNKEKNIVEFLADKRGREVVKELIVSPRKSEWGLKDSTEDEIEYRKLKEKNSLEKLFEIKEYHLDTFDNHFIQLVAPLSALFLLSSIFVSLRYLFRQEKNKEEEKK